MHGETQQALQKKKIGIWLGLHHTYQAMTGWFWEISMVRDLEAELTTVVI